MIELPEAMARAQELKTHLAGKTVARVLPPSVPHKFCWFNGDVEQYQPLLAGQTVQEAVGFGIFVEIRFTAGRCLCFNDGVNVRLWPSMEAAPAKYQLLLAFTDGAVLTLTVAMYGGIICHQQDYDNEYYQSSQQKPSPLSDEFNSSYFDQLLADVKANTSAKAFLATKQRIPGLGNGVLQDILLLARVHPKRPVGSLSPLERKRLFQCVTGVLAQMTVRGGRDTEKDLFGQPGGYRTQLSKNTLAQGCPQCGGELVKETYLGGTVYYCPHCQKN